MERRRLKTIIILILALLNIFLLWSVAPRDLSRLSSRHDAAQQLSHIFAADGIALDGDLIPREAPPSPRTLRRDEALEAKLAAALLGDAPAAANQGGGIRTYESALGTAVFRENGSFEATGTFAAENGAAFCSALCETLGCAPPDLLLDDDGSGSAETHFLREKIPIYNCAVTFTLSRGAVIRAAGTIPGADAGSGSSAELLSASAALTAFHRHIRESGAVISAVTEILPCYELQTTALSSMTLVPCWRITADTANYYVNCMTGAITLA